MSRPEQIKQPVLYPDGKPLPSELEEDTDDDSLPSEQGDDADDNVLAETDPAVAAFFKALEIVVLDEAEKTKIISNPPISFENK